LTKLKGASHIVRNEKIIISSSLLLFILVVTYTVFPPANADTAMQNCSGCVNNTNTQILTIFNFQTNDNPYLAGNATFLITPNPYAYTTNATDYLDLTTWFNFVVSDGGRFDSDPTPGIIEIAGVNNGTYSIMQIKNSPGFGMSTDPSASDEVFGTTGFAYVTGTYVNFTEGSVTTIEPPNISDQTLDKLATQGGAKINGVAMTSSNDLPPAKMANSDQKRTITPPDPIVFTSTFAGNTPTSTLFTTLGIPTYAAPRDTAITGTTVFIPPLFVAPTTGGGNFIMSPVIDEVTPGSNVVLNFTNIDQGTTHPLLNMIDLPFSTQATNVGVSVRMDTSNPTGVPIPSGNVALYLDVSGNGSVDLSDPNTYSSNPMLHFNLEKSDSSCPTDVAVYLKDGGQWHEVTPAATLDSIDTHTCAYSIEVEHFSSYIVGTSSSGGHGHDSGSHDSGGGGHGGHGGHGGSGAAHGMGEHGFGGKIEDQLKLYEISYDVCKDNVARIVVGPSNMDIGVNIRTTDGLVKATIDEDHPLASKLVFTAPLKPGEKFFSVEVDGISGRDSSVIKREVTTKGCEGTITVSRDVPEMPSMAHDTKTETKFNGDKKIVTYKDSRFQITYEMAGGITGVEIDEESKSAKFLLDYVAGGELLLQVPRSLVDADGDNFTVLLEASPEKQIDYEIVSSTADYYTLKVNLPADAKTLTIIGTKVVPEFGVVSILVLVASIAGIVVILKTQKHVLQTGTFDKSTKSA